MGLSDEFGPTNRLRLSNSNVTPSEVLEFLSVDCLNRRASPLGETCYRFPPSREFTASRSNRSGS